MSRSSCRSNGRYLSTTIPEFWSRIQLAKDALCSGLENLRHSRKKGKDGQESTNHWIVQASPDVNAELIRRFYEKTKYG
jgi:hypothetical protein